MRCTLISQLVLTAAAVLAGSGTAVAQHRGGTRPPAPPRGQSQNHQQQMEHQQRQMMEQQRVHEQQMMMEHQRRMALQAEQERRLRQEAIARSRAAHGGAAQPSRGGHPNHPVTAIVDPTTPTPRSSGGRTGSGNAVRSKGREGAEHAGTPASSGGPGSPSGASVPASSTSGAKGPSGAAASSWSFNDGDFRGFVGWHRHHHGHHEYPQFDSPEAFRMWIAREEKLMQGGKMPDALFREFLLMPGMLGLSPGQLRHYERMFRYEEALLDGGYGGPAFTAWVSRHRHIQAYQNWLREQKFRIQKGQPVDPWYLRLLELEAEADSTSPSGSR